MRPNKAAGEEKRLVLVALKEVDGVARGHPVGMHQIVALRLYTFERLRALILGRPMGAHALSVLFGCLDVDHLVPRVRIVARGGPGDNLVEASLEMPVIVMLS